MPKLDYRKSTTGCLRCKNRKVKCPEERPSCSACTRHQVPCEYVSSKPRAAAKSNTLARRGEHSKGVTSPELNPSGIPSPSPGASDLELRLFHYFLSHTRYGLRTSDDFWAIRAPLIAFEYRPVFDGMLAIAALHMYRQTLDNTFIFCAPTTIRDSPSAWTSHGRSPAGRRSCEVFEAYLHYFDAAVAGQRQLMQEADLRAAYVSSTLISIIALVSLGSSSDEVHRSELENGDGRLWFSLAIGPRELIPLWIQRSGDDALREMGVFDDRPNFRDVEELFNRRHAIPFWGLLDFGAEFETITPEEHMAYQNTLSYVGLIYANLIGRVEEPAVTSRRFIALPARAPPVFCQMVLQQRPRAMAILAYAFALMRLLENEIPWYRGIAAKQIPYVARELPPAWQRAMKWPLAMLAVSPSDKVTLPDPGSPEFSLLK